MCISIYIYIYIYIYAYPIDMVHTLCGAQVKCYLQHLTLVEPLIAYGQFSNFMFVFAA